MKIENRTIDIAKNENEKKRYSDIIIEMIDLLKMPVALSQMKERLNEIDLIKSAGDEFEISDYILNFVKTNLCNVGFPVHRDLAEFTDYINSL